MNFFLRRLILLCCVMALFSLAVNGQIKPQTIDDLSSPIRKDSNVTYSDLVDLVFPETAEGVRKSIPLTNIFGDYKNNVYEGKFEADYARAVWINNEGRKQLLLLINFSSKNGGEDFSWGEMNVLALFDVQDKPKLIDAVDVQADRFAFFSEEQPILHVSPQTDAFLIVNHHFNAGEGFINLALISIVKNRFKIILDDIKTLMNVSSCGANYEEKAFLKLNLKSSQNSYRNIAVNIKYIRHPDDADCERKNRGYTKIYSYQYAWNSKRGKYLKLKGKK